MSVEIEAKMKLDDREDLLAKLKYFDAVYVKEVVEINTFFDAPDRALRVGDQGLRVRVERATDGSKVIATVTHKGPRSRGLLKTREETEMRVSDGRAAAKLLTALGYESVVSFEKLRQSWEIDDCLVELDTVPYLGDYVEIEGPSERVVMKIRERLGLSDSKVLSASYISMLINFVTENGIRRDHIGFDEEVSTSPTLAPSDGDGDGI